jgi:hypothetical protein
MYKLIFSLLFLLQGAEVFAAHSRSDSLLLVLDKIIKEKPYYAQQREHQIDSLTALLNVEADLERRYHIYRQLYERYRPYNVHSALSIAEKKLLVAKELQNQQLIYETQMNCAEIFGIMGMYKESMDMIDNVKRKKLDKHQLSYYYHLHHSLYSLMSSNAILQKEKDNYDRLISLYKDSILQAFDVNTLGYALVKNGKLVEQERYNEALQLMNQCYQEYGSDDEPMLGSIAYGLAEIYRKKDDIEKEKEFLAISAIADLRRGVKEYIALRELAILLYQEGDINRAYEYTKRSLQDALFCGARFRVLEISETLPIIAAAYERKMKQDKARLLRYLILISALSLIWVANILLIWRQKKKLLSAKKSIQSMYEDLKKMNKNLDELNKTLSESNHVKEECIGSIFNMCSTYISKMENYRVLIHKKALSDEIDEIRNFTSSPLVADELKELFANFDASFLNIYPNFIDEFNALLIDGEQIIPKSDDILTPELRVYALIRLGITDTSKIADFLHYSPQTVYNYKMKIRNKLSVSRDEFADTVRQIGE